MLIKYYFVVCITLFFVLINGEVIIPNQLFKSVVVSKTRFNQPFSTNTTIENIKSKTICMIACLKFTYCFLNCLVEGLGCLITDTLVSPNFIETDVTDLYKCYTKFTQTNIIVGKAISGTPEYQPWYSKGVRMAYVVNGIYERAKYLHYPSSMVAGSHILIDLGSQMFFSTIQLVCADDQYKIDYVCLDYYIKTSSEPPSISGDFSEFDHFGYIASVQTPGKLLTFEKPTTARYISIQRLPSPGASNPALVIQFLNVY